MLDIEAQIFSRIISDFPETILTKYSMTVDDNFSTEGTSNTDSVFPFVYVHLLAPVESGNTLDNTTINALMSTVQIDVIDTNSASKVKEIMDAIVDIMKSMRFSATVMPEFSYGSTQTRQTARFRRLIASGDIL